MKTSTCSEVVSAAVPIPLWQPGPPRHITPQSRSIDATVCRRLRCPLCGRRGLIAYHPLHTATGRYRVEARSPCGHVEEV
jgi:hypothetical protein